MSPKAILTLQVSDMFLLLNYGDTVRMSLYLERGCHGNSSWGINSFCETCVWIESSVMSQTVRQQRLRVAQDPNPQMPQDWPSVAELKVFMTSKPGTADDTAVPPPHFRRPERSERARPHKHLDGMLTAAVLTSARKVETPQVSTS